MCQDTGCFWRLAQEVLPKAYESGPKLCQDWTITLMAQYLAVQSGRSNLDVHWLKQSSVRHLTHNNPGPTQRLADGVCARACGPMLVFTCRQVGRFFVKDRGVWKPRFRFPSITLAILPCTTFCSLHCGYVAGISFLGLNS